MARAVYFFFVTLYFWQDPGKMQKHDPGLIEKTKPPPKKKLQQVEPEPDPPEPEDDDPEPEDHTCYTCIYMHAHAYACVHMYVPMIYIWQQACLCKLCMLLPQRVVRVRAVQPPQ